MSEVYKPKPLTAEERAILEGVRQRLEHHHDDAVASFLSVAERNAFQRLSEITLDQMRDNPDFARFVAKALLPLAAEFGLTAEQIAELTEEARS